MRNLPCNQIINSQLLVELISRKLIRNFDENWSLSFKIKLPNWNKNTMTAIQCPNDCNTVTIFVVILCWALPIQLLEHVQWPRVVKEPSSTSFAKFLGRSRCRLLSIHIFYRYVNICSLWTHLTNKKRVSTNAVMIQAAGQVFKWAVVNAHAPNMWWNSWKDALCQCDN